MGDEFFSLTAQVVTGPALKALADAGSLLRENLREAVAGAGRDIAELARANAPRGKTGGLAASIQSHIDETLGSVSAVVTTDHVGLYLEHGVVAHGTASNKRGSGGKRVRQAARASLVAAGSWRIAPRPFLQPAAAALREQILLQLKGAVNAAADEASR